MSDPANPVGLASLRARLDRPLTLGGLLVARLRSARWWLLADAALVMFGLVKGGWVWVAAGLFAALVPLAGTVAASGTLRRHHRLQRHYARGDWTAVRGLAAELATARSVPVGLEFDAALRLAGAIAREQSIEEALAHVESWRLRTATQPGVFDARTAALHLVAGDTAGHVAALVRAHAAAPGDVRITLDLALAHARFGALAAAEQLLAPISADAVPAPSRPVWLWATGLVQMRRSEPIGEATLAQAVDAWLARIDEPDSWVALTLCATDHAVALHQAGRDDEARERVAQVWPVLEAHATVPLLRMLEADSLLPPRPNT